MLIVCTWLWGDKFSLDYVSKLRASVQRNLEQRHRFILCAPQKEDLHLTKIKGCFARLRMFDPEWQARLGIKSGNRIVCIDLDTVITGELDPLFDRPEDFCILQGGNAANPCPYNGALSMLTAGAHPEVWQDFSLEAAQKIPFYEFPDDQGWLAAKLPGAAGWKCGPESNVYVFRKPGWPNSDALPDGARLVTFNGARSPEKFMHLAWVRNNWRD